jgi:hypothetical protein
MNLSVLFNSPAFQSGLLHILVFLPLALVLLDFVTGIASALKRGVFNPAYFADILSKDSDLFKWTIGAGVLAVGNALYHWNLDVNVLFGGIGSLVVMVPIINSIITNVTELFPTGAQPYMQAVVNEVEKDVVAIVPQASANTPPPDVAAQPAALPTWLK